MSLDPRIRQTLDGTPIVHLATVLPDGAPHAVPVFAGTHGEHIAIFTGPGSRKARNLRSDPPRRALADPRRQPVRAGHGPRPGRPVARR